MRTLAQLVALTFATVMLVVAATAPASNPPTSSVVAPTAAGGTASDSWTGTIPPGTNPKSNCTSGLSPVDHHIIHLTAPVSYGTLSVQFVFSITWTPNTPTGDTADEILTVVGPGGEVGSSDGGTTTETVTGYNLPTGDYDVMACGFVNALPQNYSGKFAAIVAVGEFSLPSVPV